jgi:dimethylargininase
MRKLVAITRAVGPRLGDCELTFQARQAIDVAVAIRQHAAYCDALRRADIAVEVLPAADDLPDAVFVEDTAVVLDEIAVITRPGAASRQPEVATVAEAMQRHRPLLHIEAPGTVDGGDVLLIGRQLFVGLTLRSNAEGFAQLSKAAERHGYQTIPLSVRNCLHLKSAVTALDEDTVLINREWVDAKELNRFRQIQVAPSEPFAANCLAVGGMVYLSSRSPRTRDLLEANRFATHALEMTEFEKAEAALTCLSLIFRKQTTSSAR